MSYTKQQIQDFFRTAEHTAQYNRMPTLEAALQIIKQLQAQLADEKGTVKHLRKKAEFDMPDEMRERFHNGQCPDACDVIDGPCACGASHSAKEWISKLQAELNTAINIKLFRICRHCNKEFEAETSPIMAECIKGIAHGEACTFSNCPFCEKRNDIWVRVVALKGE